MSKYMFNVCLCVFICVLSAQCQLEEGSECMSQSDGLKGKCVHVRRCLSVVNDIRSKKHPQLCSFQGRDPIICCTDCELVNDTSMYLVDSSGSYYEKTGQKASDKCLEHIVSLNYPCLLKYGLSQVQPPEKQCYEYVHAVPFAAVGGTNAKRSEFPHMSFVVAATPRN